MASEGSLMCSYSGGYCVIIMCRVQDDNMRSKHTSSFACDRRMSLRTC